ncbi:YdcF family protein [Kerstersia similis]|uniref:YdcF family protein n=1 Tax=Kerstersia similis TaxID=206505 RepID=UPI0039F1064C
MMSSPVELLSSLVVPLHLSLFLLACAVIVGFLRWRRLRNLLVGLALFWSLAWSLPITSIWAGGMLENTYPYQTAAELPAADVIVVLGGQTANGRPNWFLPEVSSHKPTRTARAAEIYRAGRAPYVLPSGGAAEGTVSEAEGMAQMLRQQGVPREALLLETASRNTYENAHLTTRVLQQHQLKTVLLVTSALHMPRSVATFDKQGVTVIPAPAAPQITRPAGSGALWLWMPNLRAFEASRSIIKEYIGLAVYQLRGWAAT